MPRKPRSLLGPGVYHVLNRGINAYLLSCGRYVERNPLRAGLVEIPWDYPWSSARV